MTYKIKKTKKKVEAQYKTLYISVALADQITQIAGDNDTSFNNIVISMIESCLEDDEES